MTLGLLLAALGADAAVFGLFGSHKGRQSLPKPIDSPIAPAEGEGPPQAREAGGDAPAAEPTAVARERHRHRLSPTAVRQSAEVSARAPAARQPEDRARAAARAPAPARRRRRGPPRSSSPAPGPGRCRWSSSRRTARRSGPRISGSMPGPESSTSISHAGRPPRGRSRTSMRPASPTACSAFSTRLTTARSSSRRSAVDRAGARRSASTVSVTPGGSAGLVGRAAPLAPAPPRSCGSSTAAGGRANAENSVTIPRSVRTCFRIVCVQASRVAAKSTLRVAADPAQVLGRELDRRERVLHLVGDLARHLRPGGQAVAALEVAALPVEVAGHLVEGLHEAAQLVAAASAATRAARSPSRDAARGAR